MGFGEYTVKRDEEEIDEVLNRISDLSDRGDNPFHGLTFAEGVEAGILWITGRTNDHPFEDE